MSQALFLTYEDNISYIEVKPIFDMNNMTRDFKVKQKIIFNNKQRYIQLVKIPAFFEKSFTPLRYLMQDVMNSRPRKIKHKVILIDEFLKQ